MHDAKKMVAPPAPAAAAASGAAGGGTRVEANLKDLNLSSEVRALGHAACGHAMRTHYKRTHTCGARRGVRPSRCGSAGCLPVQQHRRV